MTRHSLPLYFTTYLHFPGRELFLVVVVLRLFKITGRYSSIVLQWQTEVPREVEDVGVEVEDEVVGAVAVVPIAGTVGGVRALVREEGVVVVVRPEEAATSEEHPVADLSQFSGKSIDVLMLA